MTVYIDSFFLVNFLFDFLVLYFSGYLIGARNSLSRISASAAVGSLFSCIALFFHILSGFFGKIVVIMLMSYIAFPIKRLVPFIKQTVSLFTVFFIFGGATGILSFFSYGGFYGDVFYVDFPLLPVIFSAVAAIFSISLISGKIKKRKMDTYVEITVITGGREYQLIALYDSGNTCTDFLTGLPVIIAEDVFFGIERRESSFLTASGEGKMELFYPDEIKVKFNEETLCGRDVAIGVIDRKLSEDEKFNALIGGICFERLTCKSKTTDT